MDAGDDAERRKFRLAPARQDLDVRPADGLALGNEGRAVAGIA